MNIGDKVRTNNFYLNHGYNWLFESNPIKAGTITNIKTVDNHVIVNVKLKNGKYRSINEKFLEVI